MQIPAAKASAWGQGTRICWAPSAIFRQRSTQSCPCGSAAPVEETLCRPTGPGFQASSDRATAATFCTLFAPSRPASAMKISYGTFSLSTKSTSANGILAGSRISIRDGRSLWMKSVSKSHSCDEDRLKPSDCGMPPAALNSLTRAPSKPMLTSKIITGCASAASSWARWRAMVPIAPAPVTSSLRMARSGSGHAFNRLAHLAQGVCGHKCRAFRAMLRKSLLEYSKIAHDQGALFLSERLRTGMTDIDRRRTNVPKSALARTQAKIGILEIARSEVFGQRTNVVETGAGYVETKANPARNVDDSAFVEVVRQFCRSARTSRREPRGLAV